MDELIKSLKSLISDIEAMRYYDETDNFGPFSESQDTLDGAVIEWPNLAISLDNAKEVLAKLESGPVIEGEYTRQKEDIKTLLDWLDHQDATGPGGAFRIVRGRLRRSLSNG